MITHSKTRQAIATALLPAIVLQLLLASQASAALLTDSVGSFKIAADLSRRTSQENAVIQAAAVLTTVTAADGNPYPKAPPYVTGPGPAGGGLLPSGFGAPLTDSYGAKLGYCSWDNGPAVASPNRLLGKPNDVGAPVFAVVSAGLDGVFNRSCAEIGAGTNTNNDDFAVFKSTMQVKFGAAGTVYFADPVTDKAALDLLTGLKDGEMRLVKNNNALYRWDVNVAVANKWTSVSNTYTASNVDITGGQINGTQIGNITPSTGAFSTLTTPNATITGGTLNGTSIGASVASTGAFTTLTATGAFSASGNATFGGNLNAAGIITGGSFVGNGASLTNLNGSAIASGIVAPAFGGTGVNASAAPAGALLIGNGSGFSLSALAAGAGIGITTGPGSILLSNNGVTSFNARTGAVNLTLADVNGVTSFGVSNTTLGTSSLSTGSTGSYNSAVGGNALQYNSTGSNNTATGHGALTTNTTGSYDSAFGVHSLFYSNGSANSAFGYGSLPNNTSGGNNVAVGSLAGNNITTGNNNTLIGTSADAASSGLSYATAIGSSASVSTANTIVLGRTTDKTIIGATGDDGTAYNLQVTGGIKALSGGLRVSGGDLVLNSPTIIGLMSARPAAGIAGRIYLASDTNQLYRDDGTMWNSLAAGSVALSSITAATNANTINNGANAQGWNWALAGNTTAFNIGENTASTGGTGTQYLARVGTLAGSTAIPFSVSVRGTEAFRIDSVNPQIVANSGAVAAPTYTFANDTSTGFYLPAPGQVGASVAGTRGLWITGGSTAAGKGALAIDTSDNSTALGAFALAGNTTGNYNVAVGYRSGYSDTLNDATNANTTGIYNTFLGAYARLGTTTPLTVATAIGAGTQVTTSNTVVIGRTTDKTVIGATGDNGSGSSLQVTGGAGVTGVLNATGGAKLIVQNSQDGGPSRGIYLWNSADTGWGIYMSTPGAGKSLAGTTAPASIDGRNAHAFRSRIYTGSGNDHAFIWENTSDQTLMSLTSDTGNFYTRGQIYAGNSVSNLVLHTGNVVAGLGISVTNSAGTVTVANAGVTSFNARTGAVNLTLGDVNGVTNFGSNLTLGTNALTNSSVGAYNTAIGSAALKANTADSNTAVGADGLLANTTGGVNTVVGAGTMKFNTTGARNVAVGAGAGAFTFGYNTTNANTTGNNNTFLGSYAMSGTAIQLTYATGIGSDALVSTSNTIVLGRATDKTVIGTTGDDGSAYNLQVTGGIKALSGGFNVNNGTAAAPSYTFAGDTSTGLYLPAAGQLGASVGGVKSLSITAGSMSMGQGALVGGDTSATATAIGTSALAANTSGASNTAVGYQALKANTTSSNNSAFGANALAANTTGVSNVAVGTTALTSNTSGASNTATGLSALAFTTTGSFNTASGSSTLIFNSTGASNSAFGSGTGFSNTTGSSNTLIGASAGQSNSTGSNNTLIGASTGNNNTTGLNNTLLGASANVASGALSYATAIGSGASVSTGNTLVLGRAADKTVIGATGDDGSAYNLQVTGGIKALSGGLRVSGGDLVLNSPTIIGLLSARPAAGITGRVYLASDTNQLYRDDGTMWNSLAAGSVALSSITAATNANTINNGANAQTWNWQLAANTTAFNIGENVASTGGTGTQYLASIGTLAGSTAVPFRVATRGVEAFRVDSVNPQLVANNGTTAAPSYSFNGDQSTGFYLPLAGQLGASVGGVKSLLITAGSMSVGKGALAVNASGDATAIGTNALAANTSGYLNTAVGVNSLLVNTTGNRNSAFGADALRSNTTGIANTGIGNNALSGNIAGDHNVAIGISALVTNQYGSNNLAFGSEALHDNVNGSNNVAIGRNSLHGNISNNNVAIGGAALFSNVTGSGSVAIGYSALSSNTGGTNNVAIGNNAMASSTGGDYNIGIGYLSLLSNTSGSYNVAVAPYSLQSNTTGSGNMAYGVAALYLNTTGSFNVAVGRDALKNNSTGSNNTASGDQALTSNTTGIQNTATGSGALGANTTGNYNEATGVGSLSGNTTGYINDAYGVLALAGNTSGAGNVAMGHRAGYSTSANVTTNANTTGNNNTFLGSYAMPGTTTQLSYATALGSNALVTTSNTIALGRAIDKTVIGATGDDGTAYNLQVTGGIKAISGGFNVNNGTAAAPSYTFAGDATTGLYLPAAGQLAASVGGVRSMLITSTLNTGVGYVALQGNSTGAQNTAVGGYGQYRTTTGSNNSSFGVSAMISNTTGSGNTAIGTQAYDTAPGGTPSFLTTASNSTFIGYRSSVPDNAIMAATGRITLLGADTSASGLGAANANAYMTAIGSGASVTSVNTVVLGRTTDKTVIGATGDDGSAYNLQVTGGIKALSGGFNANNGTAAAPSYSFAGETTTGLYLPAAGQLAASVSGVRSMLLAVGSTGVGIGALLNDSAISNNNSAFGLNAMGTNSTGTGNTAIGEGALYLNTSGANNVALGRRAGHATLANVATNTNISGSNNTFLGAYAMPGTTTQLSYATALGSEALVTTSNTIILGRATDNVAIGQTGAGAYQFTVNGTAGGTSAYAVSSDRRFKMNITPVINAVNTIKSLEGVHYEFNQAAFPEKKFESGRQLGFIAQQIENFIPEVVRTDRFGYKSVQYSQIVPLLAEGIKEQQLVLQYLVKKDPTTLLVDIKTFQANDAVFENIKSTNIKTANLEAESARIKKLDADRIEARFVRSDVMKTGEVEIFVSLGSFQPIFNPLQDSQYIVNATAEDGSSAFASVAYMSGRLTVTPISGKGVDVTAIGTQVGLVAASKKIKATWIRMS